MDMPPIVSAPEWEDSPEGYPQTPPYDWWRWHDSYEETVAAGSD